jgi:hypothetical protein
MMRRLAALSVALVAATPVAAQDARLAARLDPPVLNRVTYMLDSVRSAGLPTEPLVDKALEGASKRASGDRIVAAVRTLAGDLGAARNALGRTAGEPELVAGAAAIRAGATQRDLARLRSGRNGSLTVPLAVLANLMARGVPSDTASSVVYRLAARGAPDEEFTDLQREVERDIGTGASPAAAASVRGKARTGQANPADRGNPGNAGRPGSSGGTPGNKGRPANPGNSGNPGNPGAGRPGNSGNPGGVGRPENPGNQGNPGGRGRGNPGSAQPNPGRGGGPPQAAPGNGRGRGQQPPGQTSRQPGNSRPR